MNGSRCFKDVPRATWDFHVGGHQAEEITEAPRKQGRQQPTGSVLTDEGTTAASLSR